ncbi:MAG: hypothetical protein U0U25_01025 [Flavobacteriales bacterium]
MKRSRIILLVVLVLAAVGGWVAWRMYERPVQQAADAQADITIDAAALLQAFQGDEVAAGKQYNDKVLQVAGRVREVSVAAGSPTTVYLETGDAMAGISCEFPAGVDVPAMTGADVKVKGFCAGYNLDVELKRCAIVE